MKQPDLFKNMSSSYLKRVTVLMMLAFASANLFADTLTVTADRTTISADETVQIKVRYDEQVIFGDLDLGPLQKDFAILKSGRQQQYSNVNGKSISFTDWNIVLQPKSKGTLIIPAIEFKGVVSDPFTIKVTDAKLPTSGQQGEPVFVESAISHRSAYVQQQLILTYRLFMAIPLKNLTMSDIKLPSVEIHKLDESHYQKNIGGINYKVIEISFALFPQSSGTLQIPAGQFAGYIPTTRNDPFFGSLFSNGKRFNLSADEFQIDVKAKPTQITDHWLPASDLALSEKWSNDLSDLRVGEPITRTIVINAQGVTANQLPEIKIAENDLYRVYPDQPVLNEEPRPVGMIAQRSESIAFVPSKAGDIELPAVAIKWWDTQNNRLRTATLPSQTIKVKPAVNQIYSPQSTPQQQASEKVALEPSGEQTNSVWLKISIALNALLLLLVLGLMQRKPTIIADENPKPSAMKNTEKNLFNAIRNSAKANNPQQFQQNLLRWAQHRWPEEALITIEDFVEFCGDNNLRKKLTELSDGLYGGSYSNSAKSVDLITIANDIKKLRGNGFPQLNTKLDGLKGLYPK